MPKPLTILPLLAAAVLGAAACGEQGSGFSAEEFAAAVNERGAELELGAPLASTREETELFAVELGGGAAEAGAEHGHAGGSLTVTEDAAAGLAEYERCEAAASLLCFRADNVVLLLEGDLGSEQIEGLETALVALAEDD